MAAKKPIHRYVGLGLTLAGALLIFLAALIAYKSFYDYRVPASQASGIEAAITFLISVLVDVAVRLGFLGIIVWAGGILLRYGIQSIRPELPEKRE